jgi:hypothetical protein
MLVYLSLFFVCENGVCVRDRRMGVVASVVGVARGRVVMATGRAAKGEISDIIRSCYQFSIFQVNYVKTNL